MGCLTKDLMNIWDSKTAEYYCENIQTRFEWALVEIWNSHNHHLLLSRVRLQTGIGYISLHIHRGSEYVIKEKKKKGIAGAELSKIDQESREIASENSRKCHNECFLMSSGEATIWGSSSANQCLCHPKFIFSSKATFGATMKYSNW